MYLLRILKMNWNGTQETDKTFTEEKLPKLEIKQIIHQFFESKVTHDVESYIESSNLQSSNAKS